MTMQKKTLKQLAIEMIELCEENEPLDIACTCESLMHSMRTLSERHGYKAYGKRASEWFKPIENEATH